MDRVQEFDDFVRRLGSDLGRVCYMLLGDADEAEDLAGDVLLAAWKQWDRVSTVEQPARYLRKMAANMAASRIRRKQLARSKLLLFRSDAEHLARPLDGASVDVQRALAKLPPRRRACVVLRMAFDMSEREVADTLGISVGTVKSQTSKAASALRSMLELGPDPHAPDGPGRPVVIDLIDPQNTHPQASAATQPPARTEEGDRP